MKQFITGFILIFLLFITAACSDEGSFSIDRVAIDAQIAEDGVIHVQELFTYTFQGSYEGMTRAIDSDVSNFNAYLAEGNDPNISADNLEVLEVEEEDGAFLIYSDSTDETKKVLYSYQVEDSVNKYTDVGELEYAFFDASNETDLNNVEITIQPPAKNVTENTHYFLHEDKTGNLTAAENGIQYTNSVLRAGENSVIRFIFPADQLNNMEPENNKEMAEVILAEERELAERGENLEGNMSQAVPVIIVLLLSAVLATIVLLMVHPNRYRDSKNQDKLLRLLENTDPLFIKYLNADLQLPNESFIAALFSLKQRGIVSFEEFPSNKKEGVNTFRFNWVKGDAEVDMADSYLKSWLFTEQDEHGDYFLLDTLLDNEDESNEVKKEKAEQFQGHFDKWSGLVKERENYQRLSNSFKLYPLFSIPLMISAFGLFYYFTTIDTLGRTEQWLMPAVLGMMTVIALLYNRNKWVLTGYYSLTLIISGVGFTMTNAVILTLIFYFVSLIALLIVPACYWNKDIKKLKYAMKIAYAQFRNKHYPVGSDLDKIERRLEYAITLGAGDSYAEQVEKKGSFSNLKTISPLVTNPVYTATAFSTNNLPLYNVAVHNSSHTTTTSATGGGGAGAF